VIPFRLASRSFAAAVGFSVLCAALASSVPSVAMADESAEDKSKRLYEEGQTAMKAKDYALACGKFEESYRASGIPGSLLNWADCEETRGHVGTAWSLWNEGAAKVIRDQERYAFVQKRIAAIAPRVPYVHVVIVKSGATNVHVTLDGKAVDATQPVPADPGDHTVVASADGYVDESDQVKLDFGETKDARFFEAPKLAPPQAHPVDDKAAAHVPQQKKSSSLTTAGWIAGGVGVFGAVGFGVTAGAVLGLCKGHLGHCPSSEKGAVTGLGVVNIVSLGLGVAGLATGAILLGVGARSSTTTEHAHADLYIGAGEAGVRGSF
jgi:hypothetical protein